jgi:hypothetical protein
MRNFRLLVSACLTVLPITLSAQNLESAIQQDYDGYLAALFDHFHRNPELSLAEFATAARMASELRDAGFAVTESVGGTGVVAVMENGDGPLVMSRKNPGFHMLRPYCSRIRLLAIQCR